MTSSPLTPAEAVKRCQVIMAHAWMVRTFVKHSPEVEEFPELMQAVRTVFDVSRSLESRVEDPPAYLHQLRKKIRRLREAAAAFRTDAPVASDHTNFRQAVISLDGCVAELEQILAQFPPITPPAISAGSPQQGTAEDFRPPTGEVTLSDESDEGDTDAESDEES